MLKVSLASADTHGMKVDWDNVEVGQSVRAPGGAMSVVHIPLTASGHVGLLHNAIDKAYHGKPFTLHVAALERYGYEIVDLFADLPMTEDPRG